MYNTQNVLNELDEIIEYITTEEKLTEEKKTKIRRDTVENIINHLNPGWIEIRKSTDGGNGHKEAADKAVIEWTDEGEYFYDIDGNRFIDCLGGYGVFTAGHRNEEIVKYVEMQLDRLGLHSQELLEPTRAYLAKIFEMITPGDLKYAFFSNGGAEAVEMALKLARISTKGKWFISTRNAFHGKSNGALSATGKAFTRTAFMPMLQQTYHVPYGDHQAVRDAISNLHHVGEKVAAVIVEPIQGEGGVIIPPPGYLKELRAICDEYEVALIFDEIQVGMGRTGTLWRCEAEGVVPDIMTFAKAVGGGIVPISGIVARPKLWTQEIIDNPCMLGSPTFGGNPISCVAALATIKYMLEKNIPEMCKVKGDKILSELKKLKEKYPTILTDTRGAGLLIAMEFANGDIGYAVSSGLFARKILVAGTEINAKTIRIEPPASISENSIETLISELNFVLEEVKEKFNL